MRNVWVAVVGVVLLSACSSQETRSGGALDRINQEMKEAVDSKSRMPLVDPVARAMMPPSPVEESVATGSPEPRFDLAVNNAPASQVFMALVSGTRYSMLFSPELSGNISITLKGVTMREALDAIRELYGYEYTIRGTRVFIQPNSLQTKVFQVNYLASKRNGFSELSVNSGGGGALGASSGIGGTSSQSASGTTPASGVGRGGAGAVGSRVSTTSDVDFWANLENTLNAIVGGAPTASQGSGGATVQAGPGVVINNVSGIVVVRAMPRELRLVENYLKATQLVVERQVMLEAKIIEVSLHKESQSGINWGSFHNRNRRLSVGVMQPGTILRTQPGEALNNIPAGAVEAINRTDEIIAAGGTFAPGGSGFAAASALGNGFVGLAFQTANFAALLNFLETQGNVSVLSSPRIATINNQKAVLKVGTDEVFITGFTVTASTTTGTAATTTSAVPAPTTSTLFSGISLDVMPQIDDDGNIVLHVHPAVSRVDERQKTFNLGSAGTVTLPLASRNVNETDSIVRVRDGNIVAIGGLMSQDQSMENSGLPGTTSSPFGVLLGQRDAAQRKRELVILLKPTIIAGDSAWVKDLEETGERIRSMEPRTGQR